MIRPLLRSPAPVRAFPERSDKWPNEYPTLIKPWLGGVRAYWLNDLQAFQLQDGRLVRVDGIEPEVPDGILGLPPLNLLGEFWQDKDVPYAETLARVTNNRPAEDLDFTIFDAEFEAEAADRSLYCINLPIQNTQHVRIASVFEVYTRGGFKTHLEGWRVSFQGALAVGSAAKWLSPEYEVQILPPEQND